MGLKAFDKKSEKSNEKKSKIKKVFVPIVSILMLATIAFAAYTLSKFEYSQEAIAINSQVADYKKAIYTSYDNTNTNLDCEDVQCALDKISELLSN